MTELNKLPEMAVVSNQEPDDLHHYWFLIGPVTQMRLPNLQAAISEHPQHVSSSVQIDPSKDPHMLVTMCVEPEVPLFGARFGELYRFFLA